MMTDREIYTRCIELLESLPAPYGMMWTPATIRIYTEKLTKYGSYLAAQTCAWCCDNEPERPTVARIHQIAAAIKFELPSADDAYAEIIDVAARVGRYKKIPVPGRAGAFTHGGDPDFSHAAITEIVAQLGGWHAICNGDHQYQEHGLQGQFDRAYTGLAKDVPRLARIMREYKALQTPEPLQIEARKDGDEIARQ